MSTPQPPSADQLAAARLAHWRQNSAAGAEAPPDADTPSGASPDVALLTLESARRFLASSGLLLFAPRPQHIASPAPSFVEATLGASNSSPTLAQSTEARLLLARLIAEGTAVPLNLLGAPSTAPDAPDFVASAATFPYIFTLRGDKAWKQPPSTSGATKVSPLSLNTYNLLIEHGPTSAYNLATQLGKEVTEAAVLRSLNELWQHLRVLPVPNPDGSATLWETVSNRFTKQLKSGANAGQPSALSALISLYLSQALLATETEIETFLSPLAPRSRVRDVLHALTGARQLETVAVDGKTHLHIHGELPTFLDPAADTGEQTEADEATGDASGVALAEDGTRIKKFIPKPRKAGTGYVERAKPFGTTGRPARPSSDRGADRPARPAGKFPGRSADRPTRPAFNKPWDEEKQQRSSRQAPPPSPAPGDQPFQDIDLDAGSAPPASFTPRSRPGFDDRPGKRPFASKARFGGDRPTPSRSADRGSDRPAFPRKSGFGGDRPAYSRDRTAAPSEGRPRRDFPPREGSDGRPPRRDFAAGGKPSFGDRKRPFGDRKPFSKPGFGDRRTSSPGDRPFTPRPPAADRERRPFRRDASAGDSRPPRREFTPRPDSGAGRPAREGGFSKPGNFRDRNADAPAAGTGRPDRPAFRKFDAPRTPRPYTPREGGDARPPRRDFAGPAKPSFGPRKPFTRPGEGSAGQEGGFAGKRDAGSGFAGKRDSGGFAGKKPFGAKAGGGFAAKKPFGGKPAGPRRGADAPGASTFDKFKGGNKPWGKRPPGRKPRPDEGEA